MERRDFLKGIFGAAVVAVMPKGVVDQIEKLPEPISPAINGAPLVVLKDGKKIPLEDYRIPDYDNCLYIYDEDKLIGQSNKFNLTFKQDILPINKSKWIKIWTGKYKKKSGKKKYKWQLVSDSTGFPEYAKGLKEWNLDSDNIEWFVNPKELFENNKMFHCLIKNKEIKIMGDIYIEQINLTAPYLENIVDSAKFSGNGKIILEPI
jgi:hypothetical protein